VEAVIRGTAASEGGTHVTFTQETWNVIHRTLEHDYPKLKIVGWYHTHPGFGVEFSEMDLFIQRNFFSSPTQLALVTDPLSGAVAICVNSPDGIQYLDRFWVDGREQQCRIPARLSPKTGEAQAGGAEGGDSSRLRSLEERVGQQLQALDDLRAFHYRFMLFCGFVFCLAVLAVTGYAIYSQWGSRLEPPRLNQVIPVPIQFGDKTVMIGVAITSWDVPPELNAILLEAELAQRAAAAKLAAETNAAATNSTSVTTNSTGAAATNAP
jgi:proteasome lid subunit RPN8/RPN11